MITWIMREAARRAWRNVFSGRRPEPTDLELDTIYSAMRYYEEDHNLKERRQRQRQRSLAAVLIEDKQ
jgi:hypothetical protein